MRISISWLKRQIACCLLALMAAPLGEAATAPVPPTSQLAEGAAQTQSPADAPRPGATAAGATQAGALPDSPAVAPPQPAGKNAEGAVPPASPANQPKSTTPALGTAAAPYVKPEGVPASRPAGAAIAPAKQRRVRSFAIRVGLLVGAGIAIGVVVAASMNSSSRPH